MPDETPSTDRASSLPETVRIDASLPNPSGWLPRREDLPGVVVGQTTRPSRAPSAPPGPSARPSTRRRTERDAERVWATPTGTLCPDGGSDREVDGGRGPGRDRDDHSLVKDAGIVVRLEADGVLFHEGAGRSDGRWLAVDRDSLVSLDEVR